MTQDSFGHAFDVLGFHVIRAFERRPSLRAGAKVAGSLSAGMPAAGAGYLAGTAL